MDKCKIYNEKGDVVGEHKLAPEIFNVAVNEDLVHQSAIAQMANERQVLAHTKGRGDVRGGGRKPWRQKGTGRARAGSSRSPIWKGGGVTFGPTNERNFSKKINIKMRKKAIAMVLTDKAKNNAILILDKLELKDAKTKTAAGLIKNLTQLVFNQDSGKNTGRLSILVMNGKKDENSKRAFNNLKDIELINISNINIVDLLKRKYLVISRDALLKVEKIYKSK